MNYENLWLSRRTQFCMLDVSGTGPTAFKSTFIHLEPLWRTKHSPAKQNKTKQNNLLEERFVRAKKKKRNPISVLIKIPFAVRPRRFIFLYRWVRWPGRTFAVLYFWDCINSKRMQTLKEQCVPGKQCVWRALPFTMSAARKPTWQTNFVPPAHRNRNWSA